jgi:hypothetical protein
MLASRTLFVAVLSTLPHLAGCSGCRFQPAGSLERIVWIEQGIVHDGMTIALGYRGEEMQGGSSLEPVASILRGGEPVADAMVFNSLVSADGKGTFGGEAATVYEPADSSHPARYAQGMLLVPEGVGECIVRFRVVFPGMEDEWTRDMTLQAK